MNVVNYSLLLFTVAPGLLFRIVLIDEMVRLRLLAWSLAFFRLSQYFPRFVQDCLQKIICIKRCTRVRVPRNIAHYLLPWLDLFVLQQTNMIIGELRKFVALWGQSRLEAFGPFLFCEESCAFLCRLFFCCCLEFNWRACYWPMCACSDCTIQIVWVLMAHSQSEMQGMQLGISV